LTAYKLRRRKGNRGAKEVKTTKKNIPSWHHAPPLQVNRSFEHLLSKTETGLAYQEAKTTQQKKVKPQPSTSVGTSKARGKRLSSLKKSRLKSGGCTYGWDDLTKTRATWTDEDILHLVESPKRPGRKRPLGDKERRTGGKGECRAGRGRSSTKGKVQKGRASPTYCRGVRQKRERCGLAMEG